MIIQINKSKYLVLNINNLGKKVSLLCAPILKKIVDCFL